MERVNLGDARVLKAAEHFGLVLEPLEHVWMTKAASDDFDGDRAARPILLRRVHDTHAAQSEGVEDEEVAEGGPRMEGAVHGRHVERGNLVRIEEVVIRMIER